VVGIERTLAIIFMKPEENTTVVCVTPHLSSSVRLLFIPSKSVSLTC
jgi:hypothetical protein